jgi:hypothetical protein
MVLQTLQEIDSWFKEPNLDSDKIKLLSKLAVLELCGWIEEEFDRLIYVAENSKLNDPGWLETHVKKTNGFHYKNHWSKMFSGLYGEVLLRRIESEMESSHPGDLDRLKQSLANLWSQRCKLAHADLARNINTLQTFQAPSWVISQYHSVKEILSAYEAVIKNVIHPI